MRFDPQSEAPRATAAGKEGYLATFTYTASADAAGTFVIEVLHDEHRGDQTFLVNGLSRIEIVSSQSAVIEVFDGARH